MSDTIHAVDSMRLGRTESLSLALAIDPSRAADQL